MDEGVSGAKEDRPALGSLLLACGRGEVDVVVVTVLDRFTRDERLWHNWKHLLTGLGVSIVSCDGTVDTADDESWFTDSVLAAVAAKYRRDFAKRTSAGRRRKAKEGIWVGGRAPFGFRVENRVLAHDEVEVETIRRAVDLIVSNSGTLHRVADILNEEERLPRQGNPRWYPRHRRVEWDSVKLRYALTRETLIGVHVYGKPTADKIYRDFPPVLTQESWDKLQTVLKLTKKTVFRKPHIYPLSGRLLAACGSNYSGLYDHRQRLRYYRCKNKQQPPYCSCSRIEAQVIEDAVWYEVLALLDDPTRLLEVAGLDTEDTDEVRERQLRALDGKIRNLSEAVTERAASALAAGTPPKTIADAVAKLETERDKLVIRRAAMAEQEAMQRQRRGRRARLSALSCVAQSRQCVDRGAEDDPCATRHRR